MLVDGRLITAGSRLESDICIVGAGAAGITLALELTAAGFRVLVVEAGGLEYSEQSQQFYRGRTVGSRYPALDICRLRFLGGSTNHWAGSCGRLDPVDFTRRDWLPFSGWPFDADHLSPFYERAAGYVELPLPEWNLADWLPRFSGTYIPFDPQRLTYGVGLQSPPTQFGVRYRPELEAAPSLTVLFNTSLVDTVLTDDLGSIAHLTCATAADHTLTAAARAYVLAAGGIENARLLLLASSQMPNGIGNQHDLVGRFFMDHPVIKGAAFLPSRPVELPLADLRTDTIGYVKLAEPILREERLTNVRMPFAPVSAYELSDGIESLHQLEREIERREFDTELLDHLWRVVTDLDMVAESVSRRYLGRSLFGSADKRVGYLLDTMIEARPDPENRVMLAEERDELGLRKVDLRWRLAAEDVTNLRRAYAILAQEVGRLGFGRMLIRTEDDTTGRLLDDLLNFGNHHMGTTRASDDPRSGVVDADCRVHGVDNLFVAGSSVFCTSGSVPPTVTIVALAIRLADHLKAAVPAL